MPTATFLAGPNGSGKSTLLRQLSYGSEVFEEIVADAFAGQYRQGGLSAEEADFLAGRDVVKRFDELEREFVSFIHETDLAGRYLPARVARLRALGYHTQVIFVGLRHPETAVARVAKRVRSGGHDVPEATIRRRWARGLKAFFDHYRFTVDSWSFFDNEDEFIEVAHDHEVVNTVVWHEYEQIVAGLT